MSTLLMLLAIVLPFILYLGLSWIITCGLIWVVYTCFGYEFSWLVSTGIWVVMILLKSIFNLSNSKEK